MEARKNAGDAKRTIASLGELEFEQGKAIIVRLLKELFKGRTAKVWKSMMNDQKSLLRSIVRHGFGTYRGDVDYTLRTRGLPWLDDLPKMAKTERGSHPDFS